MDSLLKRLYVEADEIEKLSKECMISIFDLKSGYNLDNIIRYAKSLRISVNNKIEKLENGEYSATMLRKLEHDFKSKGYIVETSDNDFYEIGRA